MVVEKFLTKKIIILSMERTKIGEIQERISRRRLVLNHTIQQVIINLHPKYDYSSLHSRGEIFDAKFHYSENGKRNSEKCREE